jgi:uncharacterized membrane protein YphA (DoxX/SURF4 family)
LGTLRLVVAGVFLLAGLSKLLVPAVIIALQDLLRSAEISYYDYLKFIVPIVETVMGFFLLTGKFTRFFSAMFILYMFAAIFVLLQVTDPALFPLQAFMPIVPVVMIVLLSVLVVKGAGTWSKDLDIFEK